MGVHVFIIECAADLQGIDPELVRYTISTYLSRQRQGGQVERVIATTEESAKAEIARFPIWVTTVRSDEDWVVFWLSMHGRNPGTPQKVVTSGEVVVDPSTRATEEIDWCTLLAETPGWPKRTVVLLDVCWGGSPTFTRSAVRSECPAFVLGSTREAARLELDAAAALLFGTLGVKGTIDHENAKKVVDSLNAVFSPNPDTGTPFYRVWWYDADHHQQRYPEIDRNRFVRI